MLIISNVLTVFSKQNKSNILEYPACLIPSSGVPLDMGGCLKVDLKREAIFHIFPLCFLSELINRQDHT